MTISFFQLVDLFKAILAAIIIALVFSPFAIWMTRKIGLLDVPGSAGHKQHAHPTPLAGGIVIALSLVVLLTVFRCWQSPFSSLLAATAIIFIFGIWDDAKGLSAPQKLVGQVLASIVLIVSGTSVQFLNGLSITFLSPMVLKVLNWGITIFWLVGITNSINMIDSMDGLASGVVGISFAFFMGMALVSNQDTLALFSAILLGICIGIYIFNVNPAHLFLGDSGAQTLGFLLATVAILFAPDNLPQGSSWFVPIMVLGVPIFDTILVTMSRLRRHTSIFKGDLAHTYHRLVAWGLSAYRAVLVIHLTSLILNFLAFIALTLTPLLATIIFGISMIICISFVGLLEYRKPVVLKV